jgi:hypothetical protein
VTQPTQTHPYTIEPVTPADQPDLEAPSGDEVALLASISDLGIDVRVWA